MGHEHTGQNDAGDGHGRYGMGEQKMDGRPPAGHTCLGSAGERVPTGVTPPLRAPGPRSPPSPRAERRRKTAAPLRRWRAGARDGHGAAEE